MKRIGLFKGMSLCKKYEKLQPEEKQKVINDRFTKLVEYAREHSTYYQELYKDVSDDFSLKDLPPVNKLELMQHWNDWVTDKDITLEEVNEFMKDLDNIGRKIKGKYMIFTTSGSTGNPLVAVCDSNTNHIMGAINARRTFARKEDLKKFFLRGGRTMGVFATGGFYLGNSSVRARLLMMPWKKRQMAVTSALLPIQQIVDQLNAFQPAMLGGYPSNLELLLEEQKKGNLHIAPVLIMTGGEFLSKNLAKRLSDTFHCYVQTSYSCTEGGTIACECVEQHFHINEDWLIVEPVDYNYQPVSDGVLSDKILLTNLYNYSQPFIRYEVTDRVIMHHEPCACGNPAPWLELEGRTDDMVTLYEGEKKIRLAPLALYATLKEVHELRRFQLIVSERNCVQLRLEAVDGIERTEAFLKAKDVLERYFAQHGVHQVEILLSEEIPAQDKGSGKFKHIICK